MSEAANTPFDAPPDAQAATDRDEECGESKPGVVDSAQEAEALFEPGLTHLVRATYLSVSPTTETYRLPSTVTLRHAERVNERLKQVKRKPLYLHWSEVDEMRVTRENQTPKQERRRRFFGLVALLGL